MKRSKPTKLILSGMRLKGAIIMLLAGFIIILSVIFLWQKTFSRAELAAFLPADSTLLYLQVNLDQQSTQVQQFQQAFENHPFLSKSALSQYSHNLIPDIDNILPWFGGQIGVALIDLGNHQNPALLLLVKIADHQKALDYIKSSSQSSNLQLLNQADYLMISDHPEVFSILQKVSPNSANSLKNKSAFNQITSALPQQNLGFLYLNSEKLFASLSENINFLDSKLAIFQKYLPFLNLFSVDGLSLYLESNPQQKSALVIQQLSLFNLSKLPSTDFFHTSYRLNGKMLDLLPEKAVIKMTSSHIQDQKNKLEQIFGSHSTVQELLFTGNLEQLQQNFLGQSFDLNKDIFPLFENEFALSIDSLKTPSFSLALQLQQDTDQQKVEQILLAIAKQIDLQSSSSVETFSLPDDTKGQKIVANPLKPSFEQSQMDGQAIKKISFGTQLALYFTFADNFLLASTSKQNLQSILAKYQTPASSTPPTKFFNEIDGTTEYYQFSLAKISEDLGMPQYSIFFSPFSQLKVGRKFTEIGLLSIYRLE